MRERKTLGQPKIARSREVQRLFGSLAEKIDRLQTLFMTIVLFRVRLALLCFPARVDRK
jgi:hypothetical protein